MGWVERLILHAILYSIHFLLIVYTYAKEIISNFVSQLFRFAHPALSELFQKGKSPNHVALVFDTRFPEKYIQKINSVIHLLVKIPEITNLSIYFPYGEPASILKSDKIRIYDDLSVKQTFQKEMETKTPLDHPLNLSSSIDLAIFYSKYPNICGFFPWKLDLATLFFAGRVKHCTDHSIIKAIQLFQHTEQRCGK